MTPEQLAKSGTEHGEQSALFCWCNLPTVRAQYPELATPLFFAIPNGGSRGDTQFSAMIVGGKLKAEGVKAGVSDCFLAVPRGGYHGLFIEMKRRGKIKGATKDQKEFGAMVQKNGYGFIVCDSWQMARDILIQYMEQ